ncbi:MAG: hypothetical protein OEU26_28735 [Candidatus Tectomicrobia bacterium]|nr:hypothetical protein [Candidatus Tectomicrobia bacterium]
MVSPAAILSVSLVTTQPDCPGAISDEGGAMAKESSSKASFLEVKIPQPGQKEITKKTAEEFVAIGKRLKSEKVKS